MSRIELNDAKIEFRHQNMSLKYTTILGVKVSSTTKGDVLKEVEKRIEKKDKFYITTPNPEIITRASHDFELKEAINNSDIALPDGVGVQIANAVLTKSVILNRITGRTILLDLLALANQKKWRVYILGSTKEVNDKVLLKVASEYPGISFRGSCGASFTVDLEYLTREDKIIDEKTKRDINRFHPHLLFIAFGAPKQEKWIYRNINELNIHGAMVVGGSFDVYTGNRVKPPDWVSTIGMEWFWRLVAKPEHINRVFTALVVFPFLVLKEKLKFSS